MTGPVRSMIATTTASLALLSKGLLPTSTQTFPEADTAGVAPVPGDDDDVTIVTASAGIGPDDVWSFAARRQ